MGQGGGAAADEQSVRASGYGDGEDEPGGAWETRFKLTIMRHGISGLTPDTTLILW